MSTTLFAVVATIALHGVLAVDQAGLTDDQLCLDVSHAGLAVDHEGSTLTAQVSSLTTQVLFLAGNTPRQHAREHKDSRKCVLAKCTMLR